MCALDFEDVAAGAEVRECSARLAIAVFAGPDVRDETDFSLLMHGVRCFSGLTSRMARRNRSPSSSPLAITHPRPSRYEFAVAPALTRGTYLFPHALEWVRNPGNAMPQESGTTVDRGNRM